MWKPDVEGIRNCLAFFLLFGMVPFFFTSGTLMLRKIIFPNTDSMHTQKPVLMFLLGQESGEVLHKSSFLSAKSWVHQVGN